MEEERYINLTHYAWFKEEITETDFKHIIELVNDDFIMIKQLYWDKPGISLSCTSYKGTGGLGTVDDILSKKISEIHETVAQINYVESVMEYKITHKSVEKYKIEDFKKVIIE